MALLSDDAIVILLFYARLPSAIHFFSEKSLEAALVKPSRQALLVAINELINGGFLKQTNNKNSNDEEYYETELGAKFIADLAQERHMSIQASREISARSAAAESSGIGPGLLGGPLLGNPSLGSSGAAMHDTSIMSHPMGVSPIVRASDRYVSVRDNQEPFDQLEKSLDQIKDEFARDHNRGQYAIENAELYLLNIDIVKAQIKRGLVNLDELRDQLRPSLQKLEADCKSLAIIGGTMLAAIAAALEAISFIIGG